MQHLQFDRLSILVEDWDDSGDDKDWLNRVKSNNIFLGSPWKSSPNRWQFLNFDYKWYTNVHLYEGVV